jgi:hypothetical protein
VWAHALQALTPTTAFLELVVVDFFFCFVFSYVSTVDRSVSTCNAQMFHGLIWCLW